MSGIRGLEIMNKKLLNTVLMLLFLGSISEQVNAQTITLAFPLGKDPLNGLERNPYTAKITSVLDHSGAFAGHCANTDYTIEAYTGEKGFKDKPGDKVGNYSCYGYGNVGPFFVINGNYEDTSSNGPNAYGKYTYPVLYYDGHAGYDYACQSDEEVLAAATGTLYVLADAGMDDPINGTPETWNTIKIVHSGGWETWYLHTRKGTNPKNGTTVAAKTTIGKCWHQGLTAGDHLHFEVRLQEKIVDPYGWEWINADPLSKNSNALVPSVTPLWGIPQPKIISASIVPSGSSFVATISGENFASGAVVTLWNKFLQYFVQAVTPPSSNVSPTQIIVTLPIFAPDVPENYVLKVKNPAGPRSKGWELSSSASASNPLAAIGQPIALIGQSAGDGGTFSSLATFYDSNDLGNMVFNAEVDLNGDGVGDESGTYQFTQGQFSKVTVPGFSKIGAVKINNVGDMAFGGASVAGLTQAIYLLRAGNSSPIKIAETGQVTPIGMTYYDIRGPLAISDTGHVTFGAQLLDVSNNTALGSYLFRYSSSDGSVIKVMGIGDPSPVGGVFNIPHPAVTTQLMSNGDVIFEAGVTGGGSSSGIFRYSSAIGIRKVIVQGDPVPSVPGGTFSNPFFRKKSLTNKKLVFQSDIAGGSSRQAIFLKNNVEIESATDISVIASEGQLTGTEVGGKFAHPDFPSASTLPFSTYGEAPMIRQDGSIFFHSLLQGAKTGTGAATDRGIFQWTGKEFKKVVVDGDQVSSGKKIGGPSTFIINDRGSVNYFVVRFF